jgi:hypothetical protein
MHWIPAKHEVNKKNISPNNTAWKAEFTTISTNRFSPLDNLRVNQDDDTKFPHLKCRAAECMHKRAAQKCEYSPSAWVTMVPAFMYSNSNTHLHQQ